MVSGNGSASHPYVIGPWTINNVNGPAVNIRNVHSTSFTLRDLTIAGNANPSDVGIHLADVSVPGGSVIVGGTQTTFQKNRVGILVERSSGVVLDGDGANPKTAGIGRFAGVINKNMSGAIDVEDSNSIVVRGWQLSANGADHLASNLWLHLDPGVDSWGVGAVRFFGVTNSTIDHNAANNDTDISYSLFNSSHNTIRGNTANYPLTGYVMSATARLTT